MILMASLVVSMVIAVKESEHGQFLVGFLGSFTESSYPVDP